MSIRTVDVSDWSAAERAEVVDLPYEVISSPYGESVRARFSTEAEAVAEHDAVAGMTGTYNTSWGEQAVNTEARVIHYVDNTPTARQLTDAVIEAETAHHDARATVRRAEVAASDTHMGSPEWAAVAEADALVAATHSAWVSATVAVNRALRQGV